MSIINRNRNNTNQIVKTTQIVECMVILASVLILSLNSSCSNSRHNVEVISSDSLWYDAERIELDAFLGDDQTRITHAAFDYYSNEIRVVCQYFTPPSDEELMSEEFDEASCYSTELNVFDYRGDLIARTDIREIIVGGIDKKIQLKAFGYDGDKLYVLSQESAEKISVYLSTIDIKSKSLIDNVVFQGNIANNLYAIYSDKLICVTDNAFMLIDNSGRIAVFDTDGNCRMDSFSELFKQEVFFLDVYSKKDGTVQFSCANTQNNAISIDLGGKRIIYEIKSLNIGDALGAGIASDGAYYSISNTGISKYNEETSAFDMIIPSDSFNANMNEFYKMSVLCASDNTFFLANTNGIDPREGLIVYRLTRADINPNAGKRRLSVGLYGEYIIPPTLASALYEFNKKSDSCFASIKMYDYTLTYFEDEDSKEKARQEKANELMRDILDGKGPDVIINAFDIQQLNENRYLYDLSSLIDPKNGFKSDEYLMSVINLAKTDDQLYQIPVKFSAIGLTSPDEYAPVNRKGYTFKEYEEVVSKANNGADNIAYLMDRSGYYSLLFTAMSNDFYKNGEWNFNTPEFRALAEFCKEKVPEHCLADFENEYFTYPDFSVSKLQTDGIQHYIYSVYTKGYDIYGFPSANGDHGVVISVVSSAAISSQSANKAGAWEFIKELLSFDVQCKETDYASVNVEALRIAGLEAVERYNKSVAEYSALSQREREKWLAMGNAAYTRTIDASAIEAYITMINNAVDIYRVDGQILLITKEEIQAYYYDQKNLVDVVEIMNNRVKVYKDEQR